MFEWLLQNDGLAAILAFAIVLIPVIIIHELGHFIAGRSVGVTILEFGIGFPPRIGKLFTLWGTEFTLNWLPFGGFVRPLGEDIVAQKGNEEADADRREAEERGLENVKSVGEAKPLERIWFLSAGAIFNVITAFVVFVAIGLIGIPGERLHIIFADGDSPLREAGVQTNDVIASVDGEPFLIAEDFFSAVSEAPETTQVEVLRGEAGDLVPIELDVPATLSPEIDRFFVFIEAVELSSPAEDAGIRPGDVVLTFNSENVDSVQHLVQLTSASLGQEIALEIQREDEVIQTSLVPRENPPEGQGAMGIRIGTVFYNTDAGVIYRPLFDQGLVSLSVGESLRYSVARFQNIFATIAALPGQFRSGEITAAEARPVSIVGISQVGGFFLQQSIEEDRPIEFLNYIAIISIALGFTNLLPLPALDGGRILFVLIEMVRGKPIPPERESIVHLLGLAFLLSLTVIIVINDIINPVTDLIR
jgi:regulator of sigma E protease